MYLWAVGTVVFLRDIGINKRVYDEVKCRNLEILWFEMVFEML